MKVSEFDFLGPAINVNNKCLLIIKNCDEKIFYNKKKLPQIKRSRIEDKKSFFKPFVWSIMMFRCESWTPGR